MQAGPGRSHQPEPARAPIASLEASVNGVSLLGPTDLKQLSHQQ